MKAFDPEEFEAELKRLRPANPPEKTTQDLLAALSSRLAQRPARSGTGFPAWSWACVLRWLVPAGAVAVLCVTWYWSRPALSQPRPRLPQIAASPRPVLKADKVEIDRQIVADFDVVANLPSGQPVRFRCEQWMDKVQWRDSAKGLVVEQTTPRLEIIPVRFETY